MDLKAGDPVRVSPGRSSRYPSSPSRGWPGTVFSVARKYGLAEFETDRGTFQVEFELETGYERGSTGNYRTQVELPDVVDRRARRSAAEATLKSAGLQPTTYGRRPSLELLEALAVVVEEYGQEATE